jgi:hypothetical protein
VLYARLLGPSWPLAAEAIRATHAPGSTVRAHGRLRIAHGSGPLAAFLIWLLRLPRASEAADTRLTITPHAGGEEWLRTFDDRRLQTRQYEAGDGALAERVGILELRFRLEVLEGSLFFRQRDAALIVGSMRIRLPTGLAPSIEAREDPAGERRIRIHVRLVLPAVGPLITYEGIIHIEEPRS